ncbi:MAG: hypothetical protein JXO22_01760, partial [Phycisphaerae bacterium]|nr:hypothetical protein [Phycisphaerae bacterium]
DSRFGYADSRVQAVSSAGYQARTYANGQDVSVVKRYQTRPLAIHAESRVVRTGYRVSRTVLIRAGR